MIAVNDGYSGRASYWHEQLEIDRLKLFLRNYGWYVGICEINDTFVGIMKHRKYLRQFTIGFDQTI